MSKGLLIWIMVIVTLLHVDATAKTVYVKDGSNGKKGLSWEDAFGDLHQALKNVKAGDEIWVAAGVYVPTYDGDRTVSFRLMNEVSLFGGFAGHEKTKEERDFKLNETILSGEIGTASPDDNSYTIIHAENISVKTIIDGFIISDANANGTDAGVHPNTCGAAWFNISSSPSIRNCTFRQNAAREGAAIYNFAGKNGKSNPIIMACNFIDNKADLDGGAIFNNGDNGECLARIENCYFENNYSNYGGAILNTAANGVTKVTVIQCKFVNNKALVRGSAIYNNRDNTGLCTAITKDCIYEDNLASVGKEIGNTLNNGIAGGN